MIMARSGADGDNSKKPAANEAKAGERAAFATRRPPEKPNRGPAVNPAAG
jgi:hypothetical protein